MAFTKITNSELNSRGATTLPNQPMISAAALKQEFDAPAKVIVAGHINNTLIPELEATTAAESLGIVPPRGTSTNIQGAIDKISLDLAHLEGSVLEPIIEKAHTHDNKALLDTYTQTESDLADAVVKKHEHSNKALLDTYTQTDSDISDSISKRHTHSNKDLLDTYTQTESNLASAVSNAHSHSNKALLDTYSQSESDLSDAVSKKHEHSNKSLLDSYTQTESDLFDAVSKKHSHANKTALDKYGESGGEATFDGVVIKDEWTEAVTAETVGNRTVAVFDDLSDDYGYDLYCEDTLVSILDVDKDTGTTTGTIKLTYTIEGATAGTTECYLRILK